MSYRDLLLNRTILLKNIFERAFPVQEKPIYITKLDRYVNYRTDSRDMHFIGTVRLEFTQSIITVYFRTNGKVSFLLQGKNRGLTEIIVQSLINKSQFEI